MTDGDFAELLVQSCWKSSLRILGQSKPSASVLQQSLIPGSTTTGHFFFYNSKILSMYEDGKWTTIYQASFLLFFGGGPVTLEFDP